MSELQLDQIDSTRNGGFGAGFAAGIALGGLLGASLALILTPKSGEEVRGQLRDTSAQAKDKATVMAGQVREQASALQGRAQGALGQAKERAMSLTGAGEDSAVNVSKTIGKAREDAQDQIQAMGDSTSAAMRDATAANNP